MQFCGILLLLMTEEYLGDLEFPSVTDLLPQTNHLHWHQLGTVVSRLKKDCTSKGVMKSILLCVYKYRGYEDIKSLWSLKGNFTMCPQGVIATFIYVLIVKQNWSPDGWTLLNIQHHRQDEDNHEWWRFHAKCWSCEKHKFVIVYYLEAEVNISMLHFYICSHQLLYNSPWWIGLEKQDTLSCHYHTCLGWKSGVSDCSLVLEASQHQDPSSHASKCTRC